MNKLKKLAILILTFSVPLPALAAATRFTSPNYGVESIIFGGTGTLRSSAASIPPVITVAPTVTNITTKSATVNWQTDKASNSVVFLGTTSGSYPTQTGQLTDTTFTVHQVNLDSLKKGATYYLKVRSSDVAGNLVESAEISFATDPGNITPPKLTNGPLVTLTSPSSVTVTWETDTLSSSSVDYGTKAVTESSAGRPDESVTFHQVQLLGLVSNQTYQLRIKSKDVDGNTLVGAILQATTPDSASINQVSVSDITLNSAIVQWNTSRPTTSHLRYGTTSANYTQVADDPNFTQNHIVRLSGLSSGTAYYMRLSGQDADGNSVNSDEYIFKTVVIPGISDLKVTEVTAYTAHVTWTSSSEIDELVRYDVTANADKSLIGKHMTAGNDKLVTSHVLDLQDLESESDYEISVVGKDIFGNQALAQSVVFHTGPDRQPPVIENVKTDTSVDLGSKQTVQVLVSFGIDKVAIAWIEYGEGAAGPYSDKVTTDTDLTRNKFMVIPGLRPGQSYHFRIVARDKSGNVGNSADYLVLAPSQSVSLLDLIFGQVKQNFGWLSNL